MKRVIPYLFLFIPFLSRGNEIDKLKTNKDVEQFITKKVDTSWNYRFPVTDSLGYTTEKTKASFLKIDIDNNGLTDLLIYEKYCFAVLDSGNGHYQYRYIDGNRIYHFVDAMQTKEGTLLVFNEWNESYAKYAYSPENDTLIFRSGKFIEYKTDYAISTYLPHSHTHTNKIDKLQTTKDVEEFLAEKVDSNWKHVSPFTLNKGSAYRAKKAGVLKIDIDNNGLTDLLIYGQNCFAILDTGNGPYKLLGNYYPPYNVEMGEPWEYFAEMIMLKNTPLLLFKRLEGSDEDTNFSPRTDTMVFKFDALIKYNAWPDTIKIEEINFSSDGGYGGPIFEMKIDSNRRLTYKRHDYEVGWTDFYTTVDKALFDKLIGTINYLKITSLKDSYAIENAVDFAAYTLEIKFNNGKIKKIYDYGIVGTSGLICLYNQLIDLQTPQYWD
jgi:hypothetical protein